MFASLKGKIIDLTDNKAILDVHDVGYLINIININGYVIGCDYFLFVKTVVKESAIDLYGFQNKYEYVMFDELIQINGIGPKMALNILDQISPHKVQFAIDTGSSDILKKVSGIGYKMAQKIILELKGKKIIQESKSELFFESLDVLKELGVEAQIAEVLVNKILKDNPNQDISVVIAKAIEMKNQFN